MAWEPTTLLKRECSADVSFSKICEIFKITYFEEQLWPSASIYSLVILFTLHKRVTAIEA